jgi:hypothetical protein
LAIGPRGTAWLSDGLFVRKKLKARRPRHALSITRDTEKAGLSAAMQHRPPLATSFLISLNDFFPLVTILARASFAREAGRQRERRSDWLNLLGSRHPEFLGNAAIAKCHAPVFPKMLKHSLGNGHSAPSRPPVLAHVNSSGPSCRNPAP